MKNFAKAMGLEFNKNKTGSVYLTDDKHRQNLKVPKTLPEGPVVMNFLVLDRISEIGHQSGARPRARPTAGRAICRIQKRASMDQDLELLYRSILLLHLRRACALL